MPYACKVVADSISPAGDRLTTLIVTAPPDVLDKIGRCRELYVSFLEDTTPTPLVTAMRQVREEPFVPLALADLRMDAGVDAIAEWMKTRDRAEQSAHVLSSLGVPNMIAKRLLAPFLWERSVVSGTDWFGLRRYAVGDAAEAVETMFEATRRGEPVRRRYGEWHEPGFEGHAACATDQPDGGIFKGWRQRREQPAR